MPKANFHQLSDTTRRFALTYMDIDRDYQEGTQHSRRMAVPSTTMESRDEQTVQLPIVWTATEAKRIAERWLYTLWLERSSHRTLLGPRYLRLDPADVITVTLDDGTVHTVRVGTVDVGVGFSMAIDARQEDAALYVSTAVADDGSAIPEGTSVTDQPTALFVLDTPLLRDVDDLNGGVSRYYLAAGLTRPGTVWPGAVVYRSQDDGVGEHRAVVNTGASWGYVVGTLGDTVSPFAPDTGNTITVRMIAGADALASITDAELVNGGNAALIGDEIIQFRDVADNGDGTWTLSHLLRGRRGTDVFTTAHAPAERILILDAATLQADSVELGLLDQTLWWRAVTDGRSLSSVEPEALPLTGRDLKPYAPVQASRADMAGDIVLSWQRRSRIGGAWRDGTGVAPLSEDTESYEVDILDGAGGTVLRTLTSGTNSVTYASADVTTDFGSAPADLYVRIAQISAVVGRGFHYDWKLRDGETGERLSGGD